jgi:hypothetical protein
MELYSNLPALKSDQIRLLRVDPISKNAGPTIKCTISIHSLAKASERPDFFALSYTWGPAHSDTAKLRKTPINATRSVTCNGIETPTSENLYDFLHHCASDHEERFMGYMWIDALCINQKNISERSHQVNIMGAIYQAASQVIVWLGPEHNTTSAVYGLMHALMSVSPEVRSKLYPQNIQDGHKDPLLNAGNWRALADFFRRTWFSRAWIIQEVVLADDVIVLCGDHIISWQQLVGVSRFLSVTRWGVFLDDTVHSLSTEIFGNTFHSTPTILAATKRTWTSALNDAFLYALIRARLFSCQDPRDKVYSQLKIGQAGIFPEYEATIAEVYIIAAEYIIEHSDSLLLLTCVEGEDFQTVPGLPTWVPDWSICKRLGLRVTGYLHFNAAGTLSRRCNLSVSGKQHILSVEATKLDNIVETCEPKTELRQSIHSSGLWRIISNLDVTYFTGQSREEVIWRTLITNRESTPNQEHSRSAHRITYPASSTVLEASFRDWLLWRYMVSPDMPINFPTKYPADSILPTEAEIVEAQQKCKEDPAFLKFLALRASDFDLHYLHAMLVKLFRTKQGYLGLGTQCLHERDSIWIVPGCRVPLIFRQKEGSQRYRLVGGTYIHGFMDGEALDRTNVVFRTVDLE